MARSFSVGNNMSNAAAVKGATPLALLMLLKPTDVASRVPFSVDLSPGTHRFTIAMANLANSQLLRMETGDAGGSTFAQTAVAYATAVWQSALAGFISSTSRVAFLDGANKGTGSTNRTPVGLNRTSLGAGGTLANFIGAGAEAAILDSVPSDADEATLQTPRSGGYIRPIMARVLGYTVLAYWPLYGQASPEPDLVGGFDMTFTGTPPQVTHPPVYDTRRILHARRMAAA